MARRRPPTDLSRRDFIALAGSVGLWSTMPPAVRRLLPPDESLATPQPFAAPLPIAADSGFAWRLLGPFRGGRVDAATGVPGRPHEFYFGAVNGGVWKTIDGGRVWKPVFDSQPVASIGALAVAPSAPDVLYVGSGESTLRDSVGYGNGMYKSTDAGQTWMHIGLDDTQHIGKIAVHPTNPDVVFVAGLGHLYAANPERGVFRSTDGGRSWRKVLFKNDDIGAVEVVIDPANPQIVYAGLWNTRRPPWFTYAPTNGPGGGIYKSTDGGETWKQLSAGLPKEGIGRTGIAVAPSHPQRLYAVVDCLVPEPGAGAPVAAPAPGTFGRDRTPRQGGFFRSDDGGETWTRLSSDPALWGRGWYFEKLVVDPTDPDVVFVPNVAVSRSMDGGKTWVVIRGSPGGDDYHQAWISREDPNTMVVASDQGCIITRNAKAADPRAVTWSSWLNQPTAQLYHCSVDYRFPYWVTGAQQDSGAVAVCSRGKFARITTRDWEPIGAGGESGYTAGDPLHPGIVYGGTGSRFSLALNRFLPGTAQPKGPEPARGDWTQPLVLSAADPHALYYANQFLFKSTDGAKSWKVISPDLTRANLSVPSTLDAAAAAQVDRNGKRGVIYTIAPSPKLAPLIWVGTDDGLIQVTTDAGKTWRDVTPAALTPWSRVTMLEASRHDPNTAYASVDRHQLQDFDPYIYRTRDMGKTWQRISNGLPAGVYVHVVREDAIRPDLVFAGTERGAYVSFDGGDHWQPLQLNLPVTSVRDFQVYDNDLIVATHGRGFWVIDDISPLRQVDATVLAADVHLFKPADAINVIQGGDDGTPYQQDEPWAENPPDGAILDYYLKAAASGAVRIDILDQHGATIDTLSSVAEPAATDSTTARGIPNVSPLWQQSPKLLATGAGIHRAVWHPVQRERTMGAGGGGEEQERQPKLLTGTFTAKLTVNARSYSQPFTIKPDPRV